MDVGGSRFREPAEPWYWAIRDRTHDSVTQKCEEEWYGERLSRYVGGGLARLYKRKFCFRGKADASTSGNKQAGAKDYMSPIGDVARSGAFGDRCRE